MKTAALFLAALCLCLPSAGQAQQNQKQASEAESLVALVTLLDGSQQEWEKVAFVYSGGTTLPYFRYGGEATLWGGRATGKDLSLDPGTGVITDRVRPQAGVSIKADYSNELRLKNLVLTAKPEVEDRIVGTRCTIDPCVEEGVRVRGLYRVAGQAKDRSAYLVPAKEHPVTDKADFIQEISFVAR